MKMNDRLISYNFNRGRPCAVSEITVHHMASTAGLDCLYDTFDNAVRKASAHYGVKDEKVYRFVAEGDTAWTNSERGANERAITIEVGNATGPPDWIVSSLSKKTLVELLADIAIRNKLYPLVHRVNLTEHNMYAATECPGPYLKAILPDIVDETNKLIQAKNRGREMFYRVVVAVPGKGKQQFGAYVNLALAQAQVEKINKAASARVAAIESVDVNAA